MSSLHDNLRGGTRARLASQRRYVASWNADARKRSQITLRDARLHGIGAIRVQSGGLSYSADGRTACGEVDSLRGLRDAGQCDAGWYADDCGTTYRGTAWQLPARKGEPRYIAGYAEPDSGCVVLDARSCGVLRMFDDARDALRAADDLAEAAASEEQEYQQRFIAAAAYDDACDDACDAVRATRAAFTAALRALVSVRGTGALQAAQYLQQALRAAAAAASDAVDTLRTLRGQASDVER